MVPLGNNQFLSTYKSPLLKKILDPPLVSTKLNYLKLFKVVSNYYLTAALGLKSSEILTDKIKGLGKGQDGSEGVKNRSAFRSALYPQVMEHKFNVEKSSNFYKFLMKFSAFLLLKGRRVPLSNSKSVKVS